MGFKQNIYVFAGIFALYGIYAAATEGVSGVDQQYFERKDTATAIGTTLLFSFFFTHARQFHGGIDSPVWRGHAFLVTAFASILIGLYFIS
jgi:hypothetical protein